jgi:hypothetical protein
MGMTLKNAFNGTYGFEEEPRDLLDILDDNDREVVEDAREILFEYNVGIGDYDE